MIRVIEVLQLSQINGTLLPEAGALPPSQLLRPVSCSPLSPPSRSSSPYPQSRRSPHITCLHKRYNVANAFVTKGITVKMHHLCFLTLKHNLAASTAGEPGRLMRMSHRLRSRPPEEKVSFLLWPETRKEVCLCVCAC